VRLAGSGRSLPRLFCFHHAGAGVSCFARWRRILAGDADVVPMLLPGRGSRARETRITSPDRLLAELGEGMRPLLDRPYLLYGHSLGGLIAYRLAGAFASWGLPEPAQIVLGATLPPHVSPPAPLTDLPDPRFAGPPSAATLLPALVSAGMLPRDALDDGADGIWQRRALPVIRDDLRLAAALRVSVPAVPAVTSMPSARSRTRSPETIETTQRLERGPTEAMVRRPLLAVAGSDDAVARPEQVAEWRWYAAAGYRLRIVPGGHFFVRDPLLPELLRECCAAVQRGSVPDRAGFERPGAASKGAENRAERMRS
jgi:surfactin synthase thioesterase subunit